MRFRIKHLLLLTAVVAAVLAWRLERQRAYVEGYNAADAKYKWYLTYVAHREKQWEHLAELYRFAPNRLRIISTANEEYARSHYRHRYFTILDPADPSLSGVELPQPDRLWWR